MLIPSEIIALFSYDPETGIVTRRSTGTVGTVSTQGYVVFNVRGRIYRAHRLAWAIHHGENASHVIDHANGNRADNRIINLRLASHQQNIANSRLAINNSSGLKGAYFHKQCGKWFSTITVDCKTHYLGLFSTAEAAHAAYMAAAHKAYGEFARAA